MHLIDRRHVNWYRCDPLQTICAFRVRRERNDCQLFRIRRINTKFGCRNLLIELQLELRFRALQYQQITVRFRYSLWREAMSTQDIRTSCEKRGDSCSAAGPRCGIAR